MRPHSLSRSAFGRTRSPQPENLLVQRRLSWASLRGPLRQAPKRGLRLALPVRAFPVEFLVWTSRMTSPPSPQPPPVPEPDRALLNALQAAEPGALDRAIERYGPLVMSVCRRYHADPHAAEDAAQDTFLRLLTKSHQIDTHLGAWLKAAARSVCVDQIRAAVRRRQREDASARVVPVPDDPVADGRVRDKLVEAVAAIDAPLGEMLSGRYFRNVPLRVLAGEQGVSVPTVHRRLRDAVAQTTEVLRDMGIEAADEVAGPRQTVRAAEELRKQAAWPRLHDTAPPSFPGWTRPIRVGAVVSQHAIETSFCGSTAHIQEDETISLARFIADPRFELVTITDPHSSARGVVERVVRNYELYGGLISSDDLAGLQTLDVILLGTCASLPAKMLRNVRRAVEAGTGFFNDGWLAASHLGSDHPDIMALCLHATPNRSICGALALGIKCAEMHSNGSTSPVTVVAEHPAVPSWRIGQRFEAWPCGTTSDLVPGVTVIAAREPLRGTPGPSATTPYLTAGTCGRGRVLYLQQVHSHELVPRWTEDHSFVTDALLWLAEPRRQQPF